MAISRLVRALSYIYCTLSAVDNITDHHPSVTSAIFPCSDLITLQVPYFVSVGVFSSHKTPSHMMGMVSRLGSLAVGAFVATGVHFLYNIHQTVPPDAVIPTLRNIVVGDGLKMLEKSVAHMKLLCVGMTCVCLYLGQKLYYTLKEHPSALAGSEHPDAQPSNVCIVCLDKPRSILNLPCKHVCLCKDCANKLTSMKNSRCVACGTRVTERMDVFLP